MRSGAALLADLAPIERALKHTEDPAEFNDLAISFHSTIVEGARSPRVRVALRAMPRLVPGNFFEHVPGAIDVERRGTAAIMRALRRNDGERATAEYARMMRQVGELVVQLFDSRGLFG